MGFSSNTVASSRLLMILMLLNLRCDTINTIQGGADCGTKTSGINEKYLPRVCAESSPKASSTGEPHLLGPRLGCSHRHAMLNHTTGFISSQHKGSLQGRQLVIPNQHACKNAEQGFQWWQCWACLGQYLVFESH